MFFVSVASKGFTPGVSLLFAILARRSISVAATGLMGEDCWRESTWEEWEDFGGFRRNAWRASPGTVTGMQMRHMVRRARGIVPE